MVRDKRDLVAENEDLLASGFVTIILVLMSDFAVPSEITSLAEQCVRDVRDEVGVELDYTTMTLPVLDYYCRTIRRGALWSDHAQHTAQSVGAYFGEVVRRHFGPGCRWVLGEGGLHAWRLEFDRRFLCFNPLGSALELLLEDQALGWNADFVTRAEVDDALHEKLNQLPGVSEQDFYTLSVRAEVLEVICAFLDEWEHTHDAPSAHYTTDDYEERLAQIAADAIASFE